jgi:hypothetical protein
LQRIRTTPHQHHLPTFGQQRQRACFANAGTGACDDCYFAHWVFLFIVINVVHHSITNSKKCFEYKITTLNNIKAFKWLQEKSQQNVSAEQAELFSWIS